MAVAFDLHEPTFRHKEYAEYKAGRRPMDEALKAQIPVIKDILRAMGIKLCELAGYEADDIVGTLSVKFPLISYIYTGDRDSYQLVSEKTNVCYTKRGVSDILLLTAENFEEKTGLKPCQIIDLKALMGDKSDNIPGVPGIGEKTAFELLKKYDTLDGVYEHISEQKASVKAKLSAGEESARFSYRLATICTSVPLKGEMEDFLLPERYPSEVKKLFSELEMKSYLSMDIYEEAEKEKIAENDIPVINVTHDSLPSAITALKDKKLLSLDFSSSLNICDGESEYVFPVKDNLLGEGFYMEELSSLLKDILCDENKRVIFYGAKSVMHRAEGVTSNFLCKTEDVSLMKYLSDASESGASLSEALLAGGLPEDKKAYGIYALYGEYSKRLVGETEKLYRDIELPLVSVLYSMEKEGVALDENKIKELGARYINELSSLEKEIYSLAGKEFNINSPSQLGKILFEDLKIPYSGKKGKTGKYSTSADILEKLEPDYEVVRKVLRYRKIAKLKATYIDGLSAVAGQGRAHTTYTQTITSTGRLSSVNPNLQNIPVRTEEGRELRKIFIPTRGNLFLDADYSQIELRLLAHFSGCNELIEAYRRGEDIHAATASQVFGVPISSVTSDLRRKAKAINFGIIYGMSAYGLSQDLSISVSAAQEYIDKYFSLYSEVKNYMDSNVAFAKEHGYVTTFTGRKRMIPEIQSKNYTVRSFGERAAMNMPLQGSGADIIKIAMIRIFNRLNKEGMKAKLILQVHDELIIDCPEEEKERAFKIL